ncbi:hypothetical protein C7S15_3626 [Burkholderia cepacia]|nr:hypothetical protein [Burkholderia cepacia]
MCVDGPGLAFRIEQRKAGEAGAADWARPDLREREDFMTRAAIGTR